jgi:hypothetical protein
MLLRYATRNPSLSYAVVPRVVGHHFVAHILMWHDGANQQRQGGTTVPALDFGQLHTSCPQILPSKMTVAKVVGVYITILSLSPRRVSTPSVTPPMHAAVADPVSCTVCSIDYALHPSFPHSIK